MYLQIAGMPYWATRRLTRSEAIAVATYERRIYDERSAIGFLTSIPFALLFLGSGLVVAVLGAHLLSILLIALWAFMTIGGILRRHRNYDGWRRLINDTSDDVLINLSSMGNGRGIVKLLFHGERELSHRAAIDFLHWSMTVSQADLFTEFLRRDEVWYLLRRLGMSGHEDAEQILREALLPDAQEFLDATDAQVKALSQAERVKFQLDKDAADRKICSDREEWRQREIRTAESAVAEAQRRRAPVIQEV